MRRALSLHALLTIFSLEYQFTSAQYRSNAAVEGIGEKIQLPKPTSLNQLSEHHPHVVEPNKAIEKEQPSSFVFPSQVLSK